MSQLLPALPIGASVKQRLVQSGGMIDPIFNGPTQQMLRLGDRFAVDVTLPPLGEDDARALLAVRAISKTEGETLVLAWPQPPLDTPVGAPEVNGVGLTGTVLPCDGFTPNLVLPRFTFFSFAKAGRNYLHATTRDATVNSSGAVSLHIFPALRTTPNDNVNLELGAPLIEGFITDALEWTLDFLTVYGAAFTLAENA